MYKTIGMFMLALVMTVQAAGVMAVETYVEGKNYERLQTPVTTRNAKKIEVVELFWYGCPHCFHFEPVLHAWADKLPADVDFYQMPAIWQPTMETHAKAYYTAITLGILGKTHKPLFEAINLKKEKLADEDSLAKFFAGFGVDNASFSKTFKSFGVDSQVSLAKSRVLSYGMQGTPEIIVNGKYRIATEMAGSQEKMIDVAAFLVEKERAAMRK